MKGYLFNATTGERSYLETTSENELDTWYNVIGCRCIDICRRNIGGRTMEIVLDDEGLLVNEPVLASIDHKGTPMLAGNLVFYGGVDSEGNLTDITPEDVKTIEQNVVQAFFTDGSVKKLILMEY